MNLQTGALRQAVPQSRKANFLAVVLPVALIAGILLGYFLPRSTWRAGSSTPLGDFAVVVGLGYAIWYLVIRSGLWGRLVPVGILAIGALGAREVLWRFSSLGLSIFYGASVAIALALTLGGFGLQASWYRRSGRRWRLGEEPLDPESLVGLLLGLSILVWSVLGVMVAP